MMFSTDLGLMKTAMGWSSASCSLLMAFPDTSRMQCLPCKHNRVNKAEPGAAAAPGSARYLLCHLSDRLDAGSVQVVVVLARLDELVVLDVLLHLLPGHHEVIVSAVHLVVPLGPGRVCGPEGRTSGSAGPGRTETTCERRTHEGRRIRTCRGTQRSGRR